jgi:hypothetical protein
MATVTVRIENVYSCGRVSSSEEQVSAPTGDLDRWWENVIYPLTGDGHPCGSGEDAVYEATIVKSPDDRPELVGQSHEWA